MSQFTNNWDKKKSTRLGERLKNAFNNPGPLKPRLDALMHQIQIVMAKLDNSMAKIRERDSTLFARPSPPSKSTRTRGHRCSLTSSPRSERIGKMVTQSKLALEQIVLRLNTITELGDIVTTLRPRPRL